MFEAIRRRRLRRELEALRAALAGKEAALSELRRCGHGNYGIAEDVGALRHRIGELEKRLTDDGVPMPPAAWAHLSNDEVLKVAPMMGNFSDDERAAFCAGFRRCAQAASASRFEYCRRCERTVDRVCLTNHDAAECRTPDVTTCPKCNDTGWMPNHDGNGERVWTPLMNDALPCGCGALARRMMTERAAHGVKGLGDGR